MKLSTSFPPIFGPSKTANRRRFMVEPSPSEPTRKRKSNFDVLPSGYVEGTDPMSYLVQPTPTVQLTPAPVPRPLIPSAAHRMELPLDFDQVSRLIYYHSRTRLSVKVIV